MTTDPGLASVTRRHPDSTGVLMRRSLRTVAHCLWCPEHLNWYRTPPSSPNWIFVYYLVHIREGDKWKKVFNTLSGQYKYSVMSFELINALPVFQALINDVLQDMLFAILLFSLISQDLMEHMAVEKSNLSAAKRPTQKSNSNSLKCFLM